MFVFDLFGARVARPQPNDAERNSKRWRYLGDESGSLTIFTLFCILVIFMFCGMAVDLMRFESRRTAMQSTLDRAVLAAANMDQTLNPDDVVKDYFNKSGIKGVKLTTHSVNTAIFRSVDANASVVVRPFFMNLVGIDGLNAPAIGGANQGISEVEVSLVLDISGSMSSNNKIQNLKVAAGQFVDAVLGSNANGTKTTHISVIPFSTNVNAGPTLASYLGFTNNQTSSWCADFSDAEYSSATLPSPVDQAAHFDPSSNRAAGSGGRRRRGGGGGSSSLTPVCNPDPTHYIEAFQSDPVALKAYINNLSTDKYTSIEIGTKWGAMLLDPSAQGAVSAMIKDKLLPTDFEGRPYDYSSKKALKALIVMSDGTNTTSYEIADAYKSGPSNIWYDATKGLWSIQDPTTGQYWLYRTGGTSSAPDGTKALQLSWPQVWALATVDWVKNNLVRGMTGSSQAANTWYNTVVSTYQASDKNNRTQSICTAAKTAGVTVYTIGFETDATGDATLSACATSPSHFFHASGTQISDVFAAIASDISKLKLTH